MDAQRMFSELQTGARFTLDHDADSGHVWTKTGRREYSRIQTKQIGSTSAPVTPISIEPDEEGDAIVMLRNLAGFVESLRTISRLKRDGNDVIAASDLDQLLTRFTAGGSTDELTAATGHRLIGIPDPDPREPVITKADIDKDRANAPRPSFYPCGCSRLKVAAGLCSVYDTDGTERSE